VQKNATEEWVIDIDVAIEIAGTRSELSRLRKPALLINNSYLAKRGNGFAVLGTPKQVADTRKRGEEGQSSLLMHQKKPEHKGSEIGEPLYIKSPTDTSPHRKENFNTFTYGQG
jgi:hypothetical protein